MVLLCDEGIFEIGMANEGGFSIGIEKKCSMLCSECSAVFSNLSKDSAAEIPNSTHQTKRRKKTTDFLAVTGTKPLIEIVLYPCFCLDQRK